MAKVRVPLFGAPLKAVVFDTTATDGAVIGVNLFDQSGKVFDLNAAIKNAIAADGGSSSGGSGANTTDELPEGAYNLYFTVTRAQSAVGSMLVDTANVTLTYDGSAPSLEADLTTTGVTPGTYGDSTRYPWFTVDDRGRLTGAGTYPASSGGGEILVADGISSPPIMLTNEAEDDFLYSD